MKLPIQLDIEGDTVWTVYRAERDVAKDSMEDLRRFLWRWRDIYPFRVDQLFINQDVLDVVRLEELGSQDLIATNILLPRSIFEAMLDAKKFRVSLNTAFIQGNGGMEAFQ